MFTSSVHPVYILLSGLSWTSSSSHSIPGPVLLQRGTVHPVFILFISCLHPVVRSVLDPQQRSSYPVQGQSCDKGDVCWLVGCLTSQQQASVSQGRICSDNFTCCHTEIEVADQTFYLTQSQYTDTGPTSPSADPITPGAWQGSHWSANF